MFFFYVYIVRRGGRFLWLVRKLDEGKEILSLIVIGVLKVFII